MAIIFNSAVVAQETEQKYEGFSLGASLGGFTGSKLNKSGKFIAVSALWREQLGKKVFGLELEYDFFLKTDKKGRLHGELSAGYVISDDILLSVHAGVIYRPDYETSLAVASYYVDTKFGVSGELNISKNMSVRLKFNMASDKLEGGKYYFGLLGVLYKF